jgi:hypothetical protein
MVTLGAAANRGRANAIGVGGLRAGRNNENTINKMIVFRDLRFKRLLLRDNTMQT